MKAKIESLRGEARALIDRASGSQGLEALRVRFLGRKGEITSLLRGLGGLSAQERPVAGQMVNALKAEIHEYLEARLRELHSHEEGARLSGEAIDVTLPGLPVSRGALHPLSRITARINGIFMGLGFVVEEGPEVETERYNFTALNFSPDHPAKDMQATVYLSDTLLLRTHTSPVQIRVMEGQQPPVRCIMPGRVYRCDSDVSHSPMFHQVEGLLVDEGVSFGDLKGVLAFFVQRMFGPRTKIRFRPSYFPFTEPSAEIDISCV
ncbi:MAG: phenylalanine--tRNA ligase subunit alpha, partial [Candidatus Aureabacteria bacterium]|nr:phenylalanine--tRNA ligase subunit alpha [Candidatus Auribacterota bacterium]